MGLLRKLFRIGRRSRLGTHTRHTFKYATRSIRAERNGRDGEASVDAKLNPFIFGKVDHRQINNLILVDSNGKSHQIDHVEIRENGIFCIETKSWLGIIKGSYDSKYWMQCLYGGERHQLLNPIKQNESHCYHINKVIGKEYIVNNVIVMTNNNAETINYDSVVNLSYLRFYLKRFNNGVHLTPMQMDYVYKKLLLASSDMSNQEHVANIKRTQAEIEEGICPRCGGKLVLRNGRSGYFYGCSNYPKCKFTKSF